jgi:hypothetical protein
VAQGAFLRDSSPAILSRYGIARTISKTKDRVYVNLSDNGANRNRWPSRGSYALKLAGYDPPQPPHPPPQPPPQLPPQLPPHELPPQELPELTADGCRDLRRSLYAVPARAVMPKSPRNVANSAAETVDTFLPRYRVPVWRSWSFVKTASPRRVRRGGRARAINEITKPKKHRATRNPTGLPRSRPTAILIIPTAMATRASINGSRMALRA